MGARISATVISSCCDFGIDAVVVQILAGVGATTGLFFAFLTGFSVGFNTQQGNNRLLLLLTAVRETIRGRHGVYNVSSSLIKLPRGSLAFVTVAITASDCGDIATVLIADTTVGSPVSDIITVNPSNNVSVFDATSITA